MATVTTTLKRTKKNQYSGELLVVNNTNNTYNDWNIIVTLENGITITDCRHYTISQIDVNTILLIPDAKIGKLDPNNHIKSKIQGSGSNVPTKLVFNVGPTPPDSKYLYNLPMTDLTDIKQLTDAGFQYQWSYDKQDGYSATNPNPDYFKLSQPNGLEVNLYSDDKTFKSGSPTDPRVEIRGLATVNDNTHYVFSLDQFIVNYPTNFEYSWMQVFGGSSPNIMLRYRSGAFGLIVTANNLPNLKLDLAGTPVDLVGKWVNWKIEFLLSTSGFVRVYKDNVLIGEVTGDTHAADIKHGSYSYIKTGLYVQHVDCQNMKAYIKNLFLYSL